MIHIH